MPTLTREQERIIRETVLNPVQFSRHVFGHDLWPVQQQILQSVAINRRTAVKACHSSGKTFCVADAVLWWITRYPDGVAITTAPTWMQVKAVLWGTIRTALAEAKARNTIAYPEPLETQLKIGPNRYAIGLSTNLGVNFQGFHGRILVVLDEAPGVQPDIWEAIEGIRAGGDVRLLAVGNPIVPSGPFYDAFTSNRSGWNTLTISAFDTPNLAGTTLDDLVNRDVGDPFLDDNSRPYLTQRRWVWEKYREWGPGHALWESKVLGNFPVQGEDSLLSLAWLEQASWREVVDDGGQVVAGIDVAGPGESETVLVVRAGDHILHWQAWTQPDPRGEVLAALMPWKQRLESVNLDSAGIGYYMGKHLEDEGYPVDFVNVGERPGDPEKYVNLKAELYWGLRMRLQEGAMTGLTDDKTIAQLTSIRYQHNARGQVVIESKENARKRGVASPDRAEAIMLAFAPLHSWKWA